MANTHPADVNEILYGLEMVNNKSSAFVGYSDAMKQLKAKKKLITPEEYAIQAGRAKEMAVETKKWMAQEGYGKVIKAWWTARKGVLSKAVGYDVNSAKNPTDVLVQTAATSTRDKQFLGLSAKSTKIKGDIGFKNPGLGTVVKALDLDFTDIQAKQLKKLQKQLPDLSDTASTRKKYIKANPDVKKTTDEVGYATLRLLRNELTKKMKGMNQKDARAYLLDAWLDSTGSMPLYIKVTGRGNPKKGFSANIQDPLKNSKVESVLRDKIKFVNVKDHSTGVIAGKKKIMKIRFKYASTQMASTIKLSGDPWG